MYILIINTFVKINLDYYLSTIWWESLETEEEQEVEVASEEVIEVVIEEGIEEVLEEVLQEEVPEVEVVQEEPRFSWFLINIKVSLLLKELVMISFVPKTLFRENQSTTRKESV